LELVPLFGRNMLDMILDLVESGLHDKSALVRHEAIECLGIILAYNQIEVIKKALDDPSEYVREIVQMVLKIMERLQKKNSNQK